MADMPLIPALIRYQGIRDEIRMEHSLIAARIGWLVTSQSFLVTAFTISRGNAFTWHAWFSSLLLPILGLGVAVLTYPSIQGAVVTIRLWQQRQAALLQEFPHLQEVFDLRRPAQLHRRSMLFTRLLPVLFAALWLVIGIASQAPFLPGGHGARPAAAGVAPAPSPAVPGGDPAGP
jgi:hypothetical protein